MNDIEMRKLILQYAYDHRKEHQLQIVGFEDMIFLKGKNENQISQNVKILKDMGLIKIWDEAEELISITTSGIVLVESPKKFEMTFPVRYDVPVHTKQLMDTVEEMLTPNNISVLNQFKKAKNFL